MNIDEITIKLHRAGRTAKGGQLGGVPENLRGDVWVAMGEGGDYKAFEDLPTALEWIRSQLEPKIAERFRLSA